LVLGLERRFQNLLEFTDLLLKFLDTLLSFLLCLSEVDELINGGFLTTALRTFSPMGCDKGEEKRTMFSSSVCLLRRVFTVSRIESFIFFLVVSKTLPRLLNSLGTRGKEGSDLKQALSVLFQLQHRLVFLLQNLHLFVVPSSFFLLVTVFHHRKFVLHER